MKTERFSSLSPQRDWPRVAAAFATSRGADDPENARFEGAEHSTWYSIRNVSDDEAEVLIYDYIGWGGVTADDFIRELADIKAARVSLRVNSPGGDVFDGIAIFNAIRRHKAYFTAYIDGIGASAASWIPLAADKVVMSPHSQLFIHDASGFAWGNAADMRKLADELDRLSDEIASMYAARAGGDVAEWRDRMRAETWFSDSEAVAAGLADEIDGQDPEEAASNALDGFDVLAAVKAGVAGVTRNENVLPEADWAGAMKAGTARAYGGQ